MKIFTREYAICIFIAIVCVAMIGIVKYVEPALENSLKDTVSIEEEYIAEQAVFIDSKELVKARKIILEDRLNEDSYYDNYSNIADVYGEQILSLEQSSSFISPLKVNEYGITATPWHYNESLDYNIHLGLDYGAAIGTELYAPANGIIMVAADGCDAGYLGCNCRGIGSHTVSGGGNQIYMMTSIKDARGVNRVYAFAFFHLLDGTLTNRGIIKQGEIMAKTGTSGNSTGGHCHIEIYYLGEGDFNDIVNNYLRKDYSPSFSCGWGETGLKHICETIDDIDIVSENEGTCRIDPRKLLPQKEKDYIGSLWDEN